MKYFNFLLENEINFTRDETGNYIALVKVLNPQYFGEKEQKLETNNLNLDNTKEIFTPQKVRSTSQVTPNKKTAPQSAKSVRQKSPIISSKKVQTNDKNKFNQTLKSNTVKYI